MFFSAFKYKLSSEKEEIVRFCFSSNCLWLRFLCCPLVSRADEEIHVQHRNSSSSGPFIRTLGLAFCSYRCIITTESVFSFRCDREAKARRKKTTKKPPKQTQQHTGNIREWRGRGQIKRTRAERSEASRSNHSNESPSEVCALLNSQFSSIATSSAAAIIERMF